MSRVRARGSLKTELRMIQLFREYHITGWRTNARLVGKPDFAFPSRRLAIFVDGCFWHGCSKHSTTPSDNREFWEHKLSQNKVRDRVANKSLRSAGWRVLRIWQHELGKQNELNVIRRLRAALAKSVPIKRR